MDLISEAVSASKRVCAPTTPALLTRTLKRPSSESTRRNIDSTSLSDATSAWTTNALRPAARTDSPAAAGYEHHAGHLVCRPADLLDRKRRNPAPLAAEGDRISACCGPASI